MICISTSAQDTPLIFTDVVQVDSIISKDILYNRARAWLNDVFIDYKEVSQIQDKEAGELSVKGIIFTRYLKNGFGTPVSEWPCNVRCKITIWVKDGRYKFEFSDYYDRCSSLESSSLGQLTSKEILESRYKWQKKIINENWNEAKLGATNKTKELIISLKEAMNKGESDTNNW
ncbi:MAG: DUF4468 domain-containing protein [Flavobacteriaceae bacterium]|nr:DUF4468 domain-containing protein [Flavobacteriaceae bacterium]